MGWYGRRWRRNIFGSTDRPFSIKHVIWQIGANIYGVMNLNPHNTEIYGLVRCHEDLEEKLRKSKYSVIQGYTSSKYSSKLTRLVEDCLRLDPYLRPSPDELLRRTIEGWNRHLRQYKETGYAPKLLTDSYSGGR